MDEYLLTVLRYLERNPVRANLVAEACQCPWSSAQYWQAGAVRPSCLVDGPVSHPTDWLQWLNQPLTPEELEALQRCLQRGTPYGHSDWVHNTAQRLGLQSTLRPRGRPGKQGHQ